MSNGQKSVDEALKVDFSEGFSREQIGQSGMWMAGEPGTGYYAVIGNSIVSKKFETKEELVKELNLEVVNWEVVMNAVAILARKTVEAIILENMRIVAKEDAEDASNNY